jgi:hypothetical protein
MGELVNAPVEDPMKRMIAFALAVGLVTVAVPAVAHEAAYPGECDDRDRNWRCEDSDEESPAHEKCTGVRNHMWTDDSVVEESLGFAVTGDASVQAYVHSTDGGQGGGEGTDALTPGVIWIETNGFSGLQRSGYECTSQAHDNPGDWQDHSDKVLI